MGNPLPLTAKQREVLRLIARHHAEQGRPPSLRLVAGKLGLHFTTVQEHLLAIYRKGWLTTPTTGGLPCPHLALQM